MRAAEEQRRRDGRPIFAERRRRYVDGPVLVVPRGSGASFVTTGATPIAITDCLNFGSPEDPAGMWQFEQGVTGLADACQTLGTPVTGGNVSFYNQTGMTAIHPTPIVGVLGLIDDVTRRTPIGSRFWVAARRASALLPLASSGFAAIGTVR